MDCVGGGPFNLFCYSLSLLPIVIVFKTTGASIITPSGGQTLLPFRHAAC